MKTAKLLAVIVSIAGILALSSVVMAGNLQPPAALGPTMKTLDEVEPRIPIPGSATPTTAFIISNPGSYYLTGDRTSGETAIRVDVNDVTIDLAGYSLIGPDTGTNYGVYMWGRSNVEVRNGTVRDFGTYGIYEGNVTNGKEHRVIAVRVISNGQYGIRLNGAGNLVRDCTVAENGSHGIYAGVSSIVTNSIVYDNGSVGILLSNGSTVSGCTARENGNNGISVGYGCTITGNTAYDNNGKGIYASGSSTITNNVARNNQNSGIYAGSGCTIVNNTAYANLGKGIYAGSGSIINNCAAYNNGGNGIATGHGAAVNNCSAYSNDNNGISLASGSTVSNCTVTYNTGDGILATYRCQILGNNAGFNGYLTGDGAGIHVTNNDNRIEANNVINNDRGIDVDSSGNLIIKNSASGVNNYDIVAGNKVGPISTDPATETSPWANFQF